MKTGVPSPMKLTRISKFLFELSHGLTKLNGIKTLTEINYITLNHIISLIICFTTHPHPHSTPTPPPPPLHPHPPCLPIYQGVWLHPFSRKLILNSRLVFWFHSFLVSSSVALERSDFFDVTLE